MLSRAGIAWIVLLVLLSAGAQSIDAQVPGPEVADPLTPEDQFIIYEYEQSAAFRTDLHVSRAARARILGSTQWHPLPDFEENGWIRLGDLVQDATQEYYVAKLVGGVTRWISLRGGTTINVTGEPDHIVFSAAITSASNFQEIVIPGIPGGKAVRDLAQLTMGIPIPRRCIELVAGDGKNYDRFRVWQPYSWYDEHMYATGVAWIEEATP